MNSMLGLAVGVCGAVFIGYCIYFDKKRRSDPNFKKKLRERRKAAMEEDAAAIRSQIPLFKDNETFQKFFLQEINLAEESLSRGDFKNGVDHFVNAIIVCSQPKQLLNVLSHTLAPDLFQMLLQQLAVVAKQRDQGATGPQILGMAEEDIE